MSVSLTADSLLATFQAEGHPCSLADLFEICDRQRFTGTVTLHFRNGLPHCADFVKPVRVTLAVTPRSAHGSD